MGVGSPVKKDTFLGTVDSIIEQWTQMWISDAAHDEAVEVTVQV